jgi:tRNA dimethylallyltransferase
MSMKKNLNKLVVILGPTASGKSDLAVQLAHKFNGEIISADSRQVYKGMDLGSGKITRKEMKDVSHYLLNVASPKKRFTAGQFKKLAMQAIKKIRGKNKIPIICGGTGFYIRMVTEDLPIPEVKPDLKLRARLEEKTAEELFEELKKLDSVRASNIDKYNKRRLIRALEIIYKTGKTVPKLSEKENLPHPLLKEGCSLPLGRVREDFDILFLGLKKTEKELKKRIALRLSKRLKQGMIKEVKNLRASGLSWRRLESFGLEYKWIALFLQNKIAREEMILRLQKDIEHLAKRQLTFFKKYPGEEKINWIKNIKKTELLVKKFLR